MDNVCIIVGAGEFFEKEIKKSENDLLIAADGGLLNLDKVGLIPDIIVGDFDSLGYVPKHENIIALSRDKDITDTWAGILEGIKKGYKKFRIYGGVGKRESHTFANFQNLIKLTKMGFYGEIVGEREIITAACDGEIVFDKSHKGFISVFSHSDKSVVCEKGFKYEINNKILTNDEPLGVSNEFIGQDAQIAVSDGIILIIYDRKRD